MRRCTYVCLVYLRFFVTQNESSQPDMPDGMFPTSNGFIKTYLRGKERIDNV